MIKVVASPKLGDLRRLNARQYNTHRAALQWLQELVVRTANTPVVDLQWIMYHPHLCHAAVLGMYANRPKHEQDTAAQLLSQCAHAVTTLYIAQGVTAGGPYKGWLALATAVHAPGSDAAPLMQAGGRYPSARRAEVVAPPPLNAAGQAALEASIKAENMAPSGGGGQDIALSSYNLYLSKVTLLARKSGKSLAWLMQHPEEALSVVTAKTQSPSTIKTYCVAMVRLFKSHPAAAAQWNVAMRKWQDWLNEYGLLEEKRLGDSKLTEEQMDKVVTWNELDEMVCKMQREDSVEQVGVDRKLHMEWLLFAMLLAFESPKRADMGSVVIVTGALPSNAKDSNYLLIHNRSDNRGDNRSDYRADADVGNISMTLVINKHKTASSLGPIVEEFPDWLVRIVSTSLQLFPRKWLLTPPLGGDAPFTTNNAYGIWFRRAFDRHFGKPLTTGLWRKVAESTHMSFDNMAIDELERRAKLAGHSLSTAFKTYRKINLRAVTGAAAPRQPMVCAS